MLQIVVPEVDRLDLENLLEGEEVVSTWQQARSAERISVNLVVQSEAAEPIMDRVEKRFGKVRGFRLLLYPLEAVLPRPEGESESETKDSSGRRVSKSRVGREELYHNVLEALGPPRVYYAMTAISVIVAAIGLLRNDLAVIIAAMVIAPLLGPNVGLALAAALGDGRLASKALFRAVAGLGIGVGLSWAFGAHLEIDPTSPAIAARTSVAFPDLLLALASGIAGALAFTSGASATLIGVMVAVALMPPLVAMGLLLGSGYNSLAMGSALLVAANLVCVNLASIGTFWIQGVRPRTWWENLRAGRSTRWGLLLWLLALVALIAFLGWGRLQPAVA